METGPVKTVLPAIGYGESRRRSTACWGEAGRRNGKSEVLCGWNGGWEERPQAASRGGSEGKECMNHRRVAFGRGRS